MSTSSSNKLFLLLIVFASFLLGLPTAYAKKNAYKLPPKGGAEAELAWCMQMASKKKYEDTINCLEAFKSRNRANGQAAEAELLIADSYFRKKDYLLAAESYKAFIQDYPSHPKSDYAYYKCGLSFFSQTPKPIGRDQEYLEAASKSLESVVSYFPNSPYYQLASELYNKARRKQALKTFSIARFYYKYGEYRAAVPRFADVINTYPGLGYDEQSLYYVIVSYKKLNLKEQALQALTLLEQNFPQSPWLKKAKGTVS